MKSNVNQSNIKQVSTERRKPTKKVSTLMNNVNDITERAENVSPYACFGQSAQIFADKTSPVRAVMACRHASQRVVLINPEFPRVFTGAENEFGNRSSWNVRVGNFEERKRGDEFEFIKSFKKFKLEKESPMCYIFKNLSTGKYKAILVNPIVNQTEKYGFSMDNNIERKNVKIGSVLPADFNITQSSSYVNDNYCAGINARMMFAIIPDVTEDSGIISDYLAEMTQYNFCYKVDVELKDNDFLRNNYGATDEEYQAFPNIGEAIKDHIICSIRENSFLSSRSEARVPHILDKNKYADGYIADIDIYSNSETIENPQINYYRDQIKEYYTELYDFIHPIIQDPYQDDTALMDVYRRAEKYLHTALWTTKEHIVGTLIRFWVRQPKKIQVGQKYVGRFGDKFVISKIVPRELMPKTDDGRPIDMIKNGLAIPNRIIAFSAYEPDITFQSERIEQYIHMKLKEQETGVSSGELPDMEEYSGSVEDIIKLVHDFLDCYNHIQAADLLREFEESPNEVYRDIIENGIYVMIPPLDEVCVRDAILMAQDKFKPILKPYKVFTKLRHRWVQLQGEYNIGYQYTWVLKQEPSKALSAIATGRTTLYDLPVKTKQYNKHFRRYSDNAIKFGEYDTLNFLDGVGVKEFAKLTTYFRGSQYESNSILMSQLEGKKLDLEKYNKFPQLDNLKAVFKLLGFVMAPDPYGMKSIGAPIDEEHEVLFNNIKAKISIPDLSYCLQMYSYYMQYEEYLNAPVDITDFVNHILGTNIFHEAVPNWYIHHVLDKFVEVLPLLQQLKQYC